MSEALPWLTVKPRRRRREPEQLSLEDLGAGTITLGPLEPSTEDVPNERAPSDTLGP